jgi:hypothetical protein
MWKHLTKMITDAKAELNRWYKPEMLLCDFKKPIYGGWYYTTGHGQAWYLLKFYPAFFAEHWLLFTELKRRGLTSPIIASLGCGCMVDAAAAEHVYNGNVSYDGYDINSWNIRATASHNCRYNNVDVASVTGFNKDTNVVIFPRSVSDLAGTLQAVASTIDRSVLTNRLYLCATLRWDEMKRNEGDYESVCSVASNLQNFTIISKDNVAFANDKSISSKIISQHITGWTHSDTHYAGSLLKKCKETNGCEEDCWGLIKPDPMMRMTHLSYAIIEIER